MKTAPAASPSKGRVRGQQHKRAVLALLERDDDVRAFHVARADKKTVAEVAKANISHDRSVPT
jgi:hypothetical protein